MPKMYRMLRHLVRISPQTLNLATTRYIISDIRDSRICWYLCWKICSLGWCNHWVFCGVVCNREPDVNKSSAYGFRRIRNKLYILLKLVLLAVRVMLACACRVEVTEETSLPWGGAGGVNFIRHLVWYCNHLCEVFSGDQPCENRINAKRFEDCIGLHHQGWYDEIRCICTHVFASEAGVFESASTESGDQSSHSLCRLSCTVEMLAAFDPSFCYFLWPCFVGVWSLRM